MYVRKYVHISIKVFLAYNTYKIFVCFNFENNIIIIFKPGVCQLAREVSM